VATGVEYATVLEDLSRLAPMKTWYRTVYDSAADLVLWHHTTLENGLTAIYPGHGGYPPGFDPRQRPWYMHQKEVQDLWWSLPYVDVSSGRLILTISMPVFRANAEFAGVTAVDLELESLFTDFRLPPAWAETGRIFVVAPVETENSKQALQVIIKQGYELTDSTWDTVLEAEFLQSSDEAQLDLIITDLRAGKSGERELAFENRPAVWAYREMMMNQDVPVSVLIILPSETIAKSVDLATGLLFEGFETRLATAFGVIVVVTLVVIGIAFIGARTITRPVEQLVTAARAIAGGGSRRTCRSTPWRRVEGPGDCVQQHGSPPGATH